MVIVTLLSHCPPQFALNAAKYPHLGTWTRGTHLLSRHFREEGIPVEYAGDEGDADVVIVRKALEYASLNKEVFVIADNTGVIVMLLYYSHHSDSIYMQRNQQCISISEAKVILCK